MRWNIFINMRFIHISHKVVVATIIAIDINLFLNFHSHQHSRRKFRDAQIYRYFFRVEPTVNLPNVLQPT
jgi:hypothetical protein